MEHENIRKLADHLLIFDAIPELDDKKRRNLVGMERRYKILRRGGFKLGFMWPCRPA
jgi:hypothetical protein